MRQETAYAIIALTGMVIIVLLALLVYQNWQLHPEQPELTAPFQAVQVTTGQVFIGRLERVGSSGFPGLREVYMLQSKVNPETKQVTNTLVKRAPDWQGADTMFLNAAHILVIEPVRPGSNIDKLIQQSRSAPSAPVSPPVK